MCWTQRTATRRTGCTFKIRASRRGKRVLITVHPFKDTKRGSAGKNESTEDSV